jgi:hypothetical protein
LFTIYDIPNKKRTEEPDDIAYSLYLYSLGLSLRITSNAISRFIKSAIRDWIQNINLRSYFPKRHGSEFIVDETVIK